MPIWLGAYKVDGRLMSFSGMDVTTLAFLQWLPGEPRLSSGNVLKMNKTGYLFVDEDNDGMDAYVLVEKANTDGKILLSFLTHPQGW